MVSGGYLINFRLANNQYEYVYKDKKGEICFRNWLLDGYDEDGEEEGHVYAGSDEFYEDEDTSDGRAEGFYGRWDKEDLGEVLRIGVAQSDLMMVEESLQLLYDIDATKEIHSAIRRGMLDICEQNDGGLVFYDLFRLLLGHLFCMLGLSASDDILVRVGDAMLGIEEDSAQNFLIQYIKSGI